MRSRTRRSTRMLVVAMTALAVSSSGLQPVNTTVDCDTIWRRTGSGWYESNPSYTDSRDDTADWQFSIPEAQGMNSRTLNSGLNSLRANKSILSAIVIRHGKIVTESYYNGSTRFRSNNVHSASKSMIQALLAIAVQKGYITSLDDKVSKYLPRYPNGARISLRNLISMASGLRWEEDSTEYKIRMRSDWVGAALSQGFQSTPGARFTYSSGNTHVLSGVLQAATGMSTCAFADTNLFTPLEVTPEHWGRDPQAIFAGGYNLYMTPRELAKFGLLYLQNGVWKGTQLVPTWAITDAATTLWQVDDTFSYSQGWWNQTVSGHKMYFGWGYGGQFSYVIPSLDIVFTTTENTADGHDNIEINSREFIQNYLIPAVTGP
ncbi:serine hydrolase [Acrocarpospora sp. B8E8]